MDNIPTFCTTVRVDFSARITGTNTTHPSNCAEYDCRYSAVCVIKDLNAKMSLRHKHFALSNMSVVKK